VRKFMLLASVLTISTMITTIPSEPEPMTESYKQKRIDYLTNVRNKSVFTDENTRLNEIRYLDDMISSLRAGIEYDRGEVDGSLLANP
jgi:hypothetical protein